MPINKNVNDNKTPIKPNIINNNNLYPNVNQEKPTDLGKIEKNIPQIEELDNINLIDPNNINQNNSLSNINLYPNVSQQTINNLPFLYNTINQQQPNNLGNVND